MEDDKFKDWSDWDAACGVMSPHELLQGDTVIYMTGDGSISVQKVGRLSWGKQYNSDTDIIRYKNSISKAFSAKQRVSSS